MAHLPAVEIQARRNAAMNDILEEWQGNESVAILCPCRIDCMCMPVNEVERVVLTFCLYPGELDFFLSHNLSTPHMVSESVGTVMCVRRKWHAGFHSNVFMKVLEWRKWGRKVGEGGW